MYSQSLLLGKTKVILPGAYVTLSVFVYHVIIKTKVILPEGRGHMWPYQCLSILLLLKLR